MLVVDDDTLILVFIEQGLSESHHVFTAKTLVGAEKYQIQTQLIY